MVFNENLGEFGGKPVEDFEQGGSLPDPDKVHPRIRVDYDSEFTATDLLIELLQDPQSERLTGLVVGMWAEEMYDTRPVEIMEALIGAANQLPNLTALFIGDMTYEENEVSWIQQCDLSPLWSAFPKLEHFGVRGTNGLSLGNIDLPYLKTLVIETGGIPKEVLAEVHHASLPELERLELYLGTDHYGWDGGLSDVTPFFENNPFPKLKYLGLRNSEIADEIATAIVSSPIFEQIEILDLSKGTMTDQGGKALLESDNVVKLKSLNLERNYISDEVAGLLNALPIDVNVEDRQTYDPNDPYDRYVETGE